MVQAKMDRTENGAPTRSLESEDALIQARDIKLELG